MTKALLDDHLLRDLLADEVGEGLAQVLAGHEPVTTNLYLFRLSRSVVSARGGTLTGSWSPERRRALGRALLMLPEAVEVVPLRQLTYRMAEISDFHGLSTLGAEAVAAAEHLAAPLYVWEGDDVPRIRTAMVSIGMPYQTLAQ